MSFNIRYALRLFCINRPSYFVIARLVLKNIELLVDPLREKEKPEDTATRVKGNRVYKT